MSADIDKIVKELGQLTVIEALNLSKKLAKEWDIDLDAYQKGADAPVEPVIAPTTKSIILLSFGEKKMGVLKEIKSILGLGLMEAKKFIEDLPRSVKENEEINEAETLKKQLEEAGGTVELK
jgi:large subunit ribosomal protein L7/L12